MWGQIEFLSQMSGMTCEVSKKTNQTYISKTNSCQVLRSVSWWPSSCKRIEDQEDHTAKSDPGANPFIHLSDKRGRKEEREKTGKGNVAKCMTCTAKRKTILTVLCVVASQYQHTYRF